MSSYQIYFWDFEKNLNLKEDELKGLEERQRIEERRRELDERLKQMRINADRFLEKIKFQKTQGWTFYSFSEQHGDLYQLDVPHLNERLGFNTKRSKGKTLLNHYISSAGQFGYSFIHFLLNESKIWIDVNLRNEDDTTSFQEIYYSKHSYPSGLIRLLFKRGYQLQDSDRSLFRSLPENITGDKNEGLFLLECMNKLIDRELTEQVWRHSRLLCILESAKRKEMVAFKYKNWISLGILAISNYQRYWEYIENVFKKFGLWETLIDSDRKGTFQRKLADFYETIPEQDYSVDELISELFPELND